MSSFFSSKKSSAASSLVNGTKAKPAPTRGDESRPGTSEIFLTPPEGVEPSKKWEYDEAQLKLVSPTFASTYHSTLSGV